MDAAIAVGGIELQRWIPAVDPKTGFLAAYQIYCEPARGFEVRGVTSRAKGSYRAAYALLLRQLALLARPPTHAPTPPLGSCSRGRQGGRRSGAWVVLGSMEAGCAGDGDSGGDPPPFPFPLHLSAGWVSHWASPTARSCSRRGAACVSEMRCRGPGAPAPAVCQHCHPCTCRIPLRCRAPAARTPARGAPWSGAIGRS